LATGPENPAEGDSNISGAGAVAERRTRKGSSVTAAAKRPTSSGPRLFDSSGWSPDSDSVAHDDRQTIRLQILMVDSGGLVNNPNPNPARPSADPDKYRIHHLLNYISSQNATALTKKTGIGDQFTVFREKP